MVVTAPLHPTKIPRALLLTMVGYGGIKLYQVVDVVAWDDFFSGGATHTPLHTKTLEYFCWGKVGKIMFLFSAGGAMFYISLEHTNYCNKTAEQALCMRFVLLSLDILDSFSALHRIL